MTRVWFIRQNSSSTTIIWVYLYSTYQTVALSDLVSLNENCNCFLQSSFVLVVLFLHLKYTQNVLHLIRKTAGN